MTLSRHPSGFPDVVLQSFTGQLALKWIESCLLGAKCQPMFGCHVPDVRISQGISMYIAVSWLRTSIIQHDIQVYQVVYPGRLDGDPWDPWDPRDPKKLRPWEVKKATCDRLARTGHDLRPRRHGAMDPRDGGLFPKKCGYHCLNPQNSWSSHGKNHWFLGTPYFKKPSYDLEYDVESDVLKLAVFWSFFTGIDCSNHTTCEFSEFGAPKKLPGAARNGSQPTAMLKLIEVYCWDLMIDLHLYQQMTPHITPGYRFSLPTWSTRPGSLWAAHPSPTQDGFVPEKNGSHRENEVPNQRMEWGIQVSLFSKYPKNVCPKQKSPPGEENHHLRTYFNHQKAHVPRSQRRKHVVISHKAQDIP